MKKIISLILACIMLMSVLCISSFASVSSGKCGDSITWTISGDTMTLTGKGRMYDYNGFEDIPWYSVKDRVKKLVIGNGITYIGNYAFSIMGINNVSFPDSVTEIGEYSFFSNCQGILTLGKNIKKIGNYAFSSGYYSNLKFGNKLETIGEGAFKDSHTLKTPLVIPNSIKTIGNGAFSYSSITSVTIPDSVTVIDDYAFTCSKITKVTIGKSVVSIGKAAFMGCHELESITIPDCVETLGEGAFYGCTSLKKAIVPSSVKEIGADLFGYCHEDLVITCISGSAMDEYAVQMGYNTDSRIFMDVSNSAWYYEGIAFCYECGIVSGMTETTFVPNGTLTRAQFVQILAMFAGADLEAYKGADSGFNDVKTNHWFNAPVCWAVEQGFVKGLSATKFGPNQPITREQLARLLYLFGESMGLDMTPRADMSAFTDESKVSDWAYEQVQWAVAAGIISGTSETKLSSKATATRAQACRMIMAFDEYVWSCSRDMSGAYAVIVEYIKANGEYFPEDQFYSYYLEADGYDVIMEYVESDKSIAIVYLTEPYDYEVEGETFTSFREQSSLYAYTLGSYYDFMYSYENANGTDHMGTYGYLGLDSYDEWEVSLEGYEDAELAERSTKAQKIIKEHIALILAEAGMTLEDFFLPDDGADEGVQEMYDALVQYIYKYGVEYPEGTAIGLINDTEDEAYITEYVPETHEICFVYVSEPIPGGNDIFDTKYHEKMIFVPDLFSGTVYIEYSYESDDSSKKITASGDVSEDTQLENFEFEGFGEEEATAKFNAAMEKIAFYYIDVVADAVSYGMYNDLIEYVCANGIEDTERGVFDLIKEADDKVYVAEYSVADDTLYFVYASEPKAGGTDVFDTEYCEKAILTLTYPLEEDEVFTYSYEKEDGTRKINGTATTDGTELLMGDFDYTGYDETTALNKVNKAFNEVISYFNELSFG